MSLVVSVVKTCFGPSPLNPVFWYQLIIRSSVQICGSLDVDWEEWVDYQHPNFGWDRDRSLLEKKVQIFNPGFFLFQLTPFASTFILHLTVNFSIFVFRHLESDEIVDDAKKLEMKKVVYLPFVFSSALQLSCQYYAIQCNRAQYFAILYNTMDNTKGSCMQYHAL